MIVYALVIWFGLGNTQTSFAISGIASAQECSRLGAEMKSHYGRLTEVACYPYKASPHA